MAKKQPVPLCKAFLVLSRIVERPDGEPALIGLPRCFRRPAFPAATPLAFFARLASAHGRYEVEVQLQTPDGETAWREAVPDILPLNDPLELYDLKLTMCPSFPKPGRYDFVLLLNGEEVAKQQFLVELIPPARNPTNVAGRNR
jgi:hypothetical protein